MICFVFFGLSGRNRVFYTLYEKPRKSRVAPLGAYTYTLTIQTYSCMSILDNQSQFRVRVKRV